MGKIRVTTLGVEKEKEQHEAKRVKREEKKKRESATSKSEKVHIAGLKGGQRIKAIGGSEEEMEKLAKLAEEVEKDQAEGIKTEGQEKPKKKRQIKVRSKNYKSALMKLDHGKLYPIDEAIPLLRLVSLTKFDGTVELHINTTEKGLHGKLSLPHGAGKQIKVEIVQESNIDKIIEKVEKGKIDFDALIAHPQVMSKLAKVARYLGPKGMMPNPKAGTISLEPEKVAEKLRGGEISWKTESEFPIIHQIIGKLSFTDNQLADNFKAFVKSVGELKIKSITLKSTMSPGIKVRIG